MKEDSDLTTAEQADRAQLREDYLRTLVAMTDKSAKIKMYENINVAAVFKACDPEGQKMFVAEVDLPVGGILPTAILRCSDMISVQFESE